MSTSASSSMSVRSMTLLMVAVLCLGGAARVKGQDAAADPQKNDKAAPQAADGKSVSKNGEIMVPVMRPEDAAAEPDAQQEAAAEAGDSKVRIVRLSDVRGTVMMDRKTGQGMEGTMQNMPIVEGVRVQTLAGDAEVEFEDNSTLRMAPNSLIEFPQLVRRMAGGTASTVKLVQGTMYVNLTNTKGVEFTVLVGPQKITVTPATHLRLEMTGPKMTLAVFSGNAEVLSPGAVTTMVAKKQTLTLGGDVAQPTLAKNIEEGPYDEWDKDAIKYHQQYSKGNSLVSSGYGISDLNYYGAFADGGCGMMWQPYLVSAAWNPYGNGLWTYYPGMGYSWVSPYPWGWLPFHTGSWSFCQGAGWGWIPGGQFYGIHNIATVIHPINGHPVPAPIRPHPPTPPGPGQPTLAFATKTPLTASKLDAKQGFVFQNNSAGLGVPRGSMGNLNKISSGVQQHGFVTRPAFVESTSNHAGAPVTVRPGSPGIEHGERGDHVNPAYRNGNGNEGSRGSGNTNSGNAASTNTHVNNNGGGSGGGGNHNNGGGGSGGGGWNGGGGGGGGGHAGGGAPPPSAPAPAPAPAAAPAAGGHTGR